MYSRPRNLPLTRNAPSKDIWPHRLARKESYKRTCEIPCFHVFTIAKHVLGLIDRSGNREIKTWQCGNPPISPRSQRITNAKCPQRIGNGWPNRPRPIPQPTGHMSPSLAHVITRLTAPCKGAEKLPND